MPERRLAIKGGNMVGILLVSHGSFSKGLVNAAELIVGKQENMTFLGLEHEDGVEELEAKVTAALKSLDTGLGVLVLVDFLGGTPCNVMARLLSQYDRVQCIVGVNLAMLLHVCGEREYSDDLETLSKECLTVGKEAIIHLNAFMKENR